MYHSLKVCLLEVYPKFFDREEISSRIESIRIPIFHAIYDKKKSLNHIFNDVAKIFENMLSIYGDLKFRIIQGSNGYLADGLFNDNTQQTTIKLYDFDLFSAVKLDNLWKKYSEEIATTIAHELIHLWQYSRRKKSSGDSNSYLEDPQEIIAWAHDITSEISKEKFQLYFDQFFGSRIASFDTVLGLYSRSYRDFIRILDADVKNVHKKEKIKKRLFRAIVNFSGLK